MLSHDLSKEPVMTEPIKKKSTTRGQTKKSATNLVVQAKRPKALDLNLWEGRNVIMSKALVNGIHCLELNEKRVTGLAMAQIEQKHNAYLDNKGSWCVEINAENFARTFGLERNETYRQMLRGVDGLVEKIVTLRSTDKETGALKTEKMPWMKHIEYTDGQAKISLKFNDELTEHITRFVGEAGSSYTLYKITQAGRLRSVYAWRLFEMLSQFRDTGWMSISVDDFHELLETPKSMRKNFANFKLLYLNNMVQELRDKCKIDVKYEAVKEGRRYTKIKFTFRDDPDFVARMKVAALQPPEATPAAPVESSHPDYQDDQSIWHADNLHKNPLVGRDANQPTSGVLPPTKPFLGIVPTGFLDDEEIPFGDDTPPPVVSHQRP
jgi:plasmid replication initiation protein